MLSDFEKIADAADREILAQLDWQNLPRHVAVIMDGNGRWAKGQGKARVFGHRAGVESVRSIVDTGARLGLKAVTLYAFSTENWKRPTLEVAALMKMLRHFLKSEIEELNAQNIRFQAIGKLDGLPKSVQKDLAEATARTAHNSGMVLSLALNYGGRAEIVEAARRAFEKIARNGGDLSCFDENLLAENLYTHNLPELDLLIRTSGEMRVSNFLLWQIAYSEIYVTPTLFPDFRRRNLLEAVRDYQKRERRFGAIGAK